MRRIGRRALTVLALALLAGCGSSAQPQQPSQSAPNANSGAAHGAKPARPVQTLSIPAHPVARTVQVPILTYHRVHEYATERTKSIPDLTVEPATFAAEIAALDHGGYHSITQTQLFEALYRGARLPTKPVLLTFDDGYADHVTQVLPVLKTHHMVATFYVITRRTHEPGFLTGAQIRELEAAGMDVGAHTRTHPSLAGLSATALRDEVTGSQLDLRRLLGHPVYWFAYPYGVFNPAVVAAVRHAGFLLATTTKGGTHQSSLAPLTMPRLHIGRTATAATVLGLVRGSASASGTGTAAG
jgi:peptidoglycan/xylan/chitin deacetylase (PgdA/CDA1 family)